MPTVQSKLLSNQNQITDIQIFQKKSIEDRLCHHRNKYSFKDNTFFSAGIENVSPNVKQQQQIFLIKKSLREALE